MRRAVLVIVLLGLGGAAVAPGAQEAAVGSETADGVRQILEQVARGEISAEQLTALLLETLAESAMRPPSPNAPEVDVFTSDSRVDPLEELEVLPATPIRADSGIYVNGMPVAVLAPPLVVTAASFTPDGFDPDSSFFDFGSGYWRGTSSAYGCLVAPANLPQGVTVTQMFASVYDNDPSRSVSIALRRVDNFTGVGTSMASATTSSQFAGVQVISTSSITNPLVLYPDYSYYLTVCLGSINVRLYSVRLYFS